jgi:hypothetical protein
MDGITIEIFPLNDNTSYRWEAYFDYPGHYQHFIIGLSMGEYSTVKEAVDAANEFVQRWIATTKAEFPPLQ